MQPTKLCFAVVLALLVQPAVADDDQVFSGPQVGEKLVPFTMKGVVGEQAQQDTDLISQADGGPVVIVFFRERTRPAFALANTVVRMAASRKKDGLVSGVCFLTDDATETENWMKRIAERFTQAVAHGISLEGPEGPGAYGLNRNVALTVLVGKQNRVTANFALVQPSVQVDGPKIFKAIVGVLDGGKVPELSEFAQNRYSDQAPRLIPKLRQLIRPLMNKEATPEQVAEAATAVEEYLAENANAKRQLGGTASQLLRSGRLKTMGTESSRAKIREWARKYGRRAAKRKKREKSDTPR